MRQLTIISVSSILIALFFCSPVFSLTNTQIKQIEEIAQNIAYQSNQNASANLDDMTISFHALATGRNVKFEYVLRVKKGLSSSEKKAFSNEIRREVVPNACRQNSDNPAFERGLSYTFIYKNCQSACKNDPPSASNFDPPQRVNLSRYFWF